MAIVTAAQAVLKDDDGKIVYVCLPCIYNYINANGWEYVSIPMKCKIIQRNAEGKKRKEDLK